MNVPSNPNAMVTRLAISGSTVTLSLNTHIRYGTTGVTVNYQPTGTPLEDTEGNTARAFASPPDVTIEAESPPVLIAAEAGLLRPASCTAWALPTGTG